MRDCPTPRRRTVGSRLRRPAVQGLLGLALWLASAPDAQALQFGESSTTGKSTLLLPLRGSGAVIGPLGYTYGLRFGQNVTDMLGAAPPISGLTEAGSALLDADLGLAYRFTLADINFLGKFNPSVGPFLGYRWLGTLSGHSNLPTSVGQFLQNNGQLTTVASLAQFHGLHYGVGFDSELPLGFRAFANAALTTLLAGNWDQRRNGLTVTQQGRIDPRLTTLPSLGAGLVWQPLPMLAISAGYDILALPTAMRSQDASLAPGLTTLRNWSVGASIFGISF
ncbi:MAG: hypothetical protein VKP62_14740 [Candidatus Sericytochromatia bacterium]|nr:hypothetical protein [Candidatus Sericytochromatia bacterium]